MCLFTHVAAGAVAGAISPHPLLAPFFGLASHVLLDVIPHCDIDRMRYELALAAIAVAAVVAGGAMSLGVALGISFGLLPDLENLLWKLGYIRDEQKIFPGHRKIFSHGAIVGASNIYLQAVCSAAVLAWLIRRAA